MFQSIASSTFQRGLAHSFICLGRCVRSHPRVTYDGWQALGKVLDMNKSGLKKWYTKKRFLLILQWRRLCDLGTGQNCADELTRRAVRSGYVPPRESVWGETLRGWVRDHNPPGWACKSACDLLLEMGFVPTCDDEWAAVTQAWIEGHGPFADKDAALTSFPAHLDRERLAPFVLAAFTE